MKRAFLIALIAAIAVSATIYAQDSVSVQGWSKDGKVLVVVEVGGAEETTTYTIVDLVSDEVLWSDHKKTYDHSIVDIPAVKYGIQGFNAEPEDFPFNDDKLGSFDIDLRKSGEVVEGKTMFAVAVAKAGGKKKVLGSFASFGSRPTGKKVTMRFVSPFENRMLVVVGIEYLHPEFDYPVRDYHFLGCHLSLGF